MQIISPEKAVEILKRHGTKVSKKAAELIFDFMNKMANQTIKNYQKNRRTNKNEPESRSNRQNDS